MARPPAARRDIKRPAQPNIPLRRARELKCWSQAELAERVGTTAFTVCRWERGVTFPGPHFRQRLCAVFECGPEQLGLLPGSAWTRSRSVSSPPRTSNPAPLPSSLPQTLAITNADDLSSIDGDAAESQPPEWELATLEATLDLPARARFSVAQIRAALTIAPLLLARGLYARAEAYLLRAQRDIIPARDGESAPRIQLYLGRLAELRGHLAAAEQWYDDALRAARAAGDDALVARLLAHRGEVAINRGRYEEAEPWLREGLQLARAHRDRGAEADLLRLLGEARDCAGDFAQGDALYQQGLELARESGNLEAQACLLQNLGEKALKRGRYDEAEDYLRRGLAAARATQHQQRASALLTALAILENKREHYPEAEALCRESIELAREIGHPIRLINALLTLGESMTCRQGDAGDAGRADQPLHEALYLARSIPHPFLVAECLVRLGEHQLERGLVDAAGETFEEARALSQRAGAHEMEASALFGLARVAASRQDSPAACSYAARSLRYFAVEGHEKADEVERWLSRLSTHSGAAD